LGGYGVRSALPAGAPPGSALRFVAYTEISLLS